MLVSRKRLGRTIRDARERNGLSQEAMAERLGISWSQYSRIERGNTDITISRLSAISTILLTPIEVLILSAIEGDDAVKTDAAHREQYINAILSLLHDRSDNCLRLMLELCASVARHDNDQNTNKQE